MLTNSNRILITDASYESASLNSQEYEKIKGSKVFIKGIEKEKLLKMASKGPQKLGSKFSYYMRVSPKRKQKRDRTRPKKVSKKMNLFLIFLAKN